MRHTEDIQAKALKNVTHRTGQLTPGSCDAVRLHRLIGLRLGREDAHSPAAAPIESLEVEYGVTRPFGTMLMGGERRGECRVDMEGLVDVGGWSQGHVGGCRRLFGVVW